MERWSFDAKASMCGRKMSSKLQTRSRGNGAEEVHMRATIVSLV
jgi:hypothetical protein